MPFMRITDALPALRELNGFNITVPHKQSILPFLDELTPEAAFYGAVNTVTVKSGRLIGTNTDGYGFTKGLQRQGLTLSGKVLLLGAGGTAHTVACEVAEARGELTVLVRNPKSASCNALRAFLQERRIEARILTEGEVNGCFDLLVNATPCGMYPDVDACPVQSATVERVGAVADVIYRPRQTALMKMAQALGKPSVNGAAMLALQGIRAQEIWRDIRLSAKEEEEIICALTQKLGEEE